MELGVRGFHAVDHVGEPSSQLDMGKHLAQPGRLTELARTEKVDRFLDGCRHRLELIERHAAQPSRKLDEPEPPPCLETFFQKGTETLGIADKADQHAPSESMVAGRMYDGVRHGTIIRTTSY
jgi:hypothetical protein